MSKKNIIHKFTVLFLIENVPYALDTRVRREAHVIKQLGGKVYVICPSDGTGFYKQVDGLYIYQYPKPKLGSGIFAHLLEYITSLLSHTFLTAYISIKHGIDVIHAANPPDIFWIVAKPYKWLGKKYIFDHHDLVPELYQVRFSSKAPWLYKIMLWLERQNIQLTDHVLSTNETFKQIAISRGGKESSSVTVVRNGPWLSNDFFEVCVDQEVKNHREIMIGYIGIMNEQDHVDNLINAAHIIKNDLNRKDIGFVLIGSGDAYQSLTKLRDRLNLTDTILMPGTVPWKRVLEILTATDICVQPDIPTEFNRHLTMNKLMEYMALSKAVIAYDMPETRVSGGDSIMYVKDNNVEELAQAIIKLSEDSSLRIKLGVSARSRIENSLSWEIQMENLESVYKEILSPILNAT